MWKVYILHCEDNTLYTGMTNDIVRRFKQHIGEIPGGAKYTSSHKPVKIVYTEEYKTRSEACKREYEIKKFTREKKLALINT